MDSDAPRTYGTMEVPGKRKWSSRFSAQPQERTYYTDPSTGPSQSHTYLDGFDPKRPRLSTTPSGQIRLAQPEDPSVYGKPRLGDLPNEILQHILSFVDPVSLGRLIRVNRSFRSLIDPAVSLPQASGRSKRLTLRSQDLIWAASRKAFFQGFPKPMDAMSELEMWRLALGRYCQYCNLRARQEDRLIQRLSPWSSGPGMDDVRTIWPFRVISCGRCLESRLIKEIDLLLSGSSALQPGLPFAIFTPSLDYVSSVSLRQTPTPPDIQLTKFYFKPQLEELRHRQVSVQALGGAALEEWYKGLENAGQRHSAATARFEQWELQAPFWKISATAPRRSPQVGLLDSRVNTGREDKVLPRQPGQGYDTGLPFLGANSPSTLELGAVPQADVPTAHMQPMDTESFSIQQGQPNNNGSVAIRPLPRQRVERSLEEVELIKADRRKEIERRCLALDPPIALSTLTHMEAFKAAILISQPLNERAWDTLRPRLLAQRLEAERRERMQKASLSDSTMPLEGRRLLEEEQRVAQENLSHMWLELKIPSRDKLQKYAQDFIHQTWSDGRGVTKATASKFAAEVLCHVRQRFDEVIAQEDRMLALKGTAFPLDPDFQACRRLKLEDMKWTFEEHVKPHTERFGKDLFLCRVCDTNHKLFSFEAVIQHYAAKHTTALSHGNAVVYWKAPWPIDPPFDPAPNIPWVQEGLRNGEQPITSSRPDVDHGYSAASTYRDQVEAVANLAMEFWHRLDGVWDLSDTVRLYVVIQHINSTLVKEFNNELSLHLFTSVVLQRPELQSLRGILGLQCKMCSEFSRVAPTQLSIANGSRSSLTQLLTHFQQVHVDFDGGNMQTGPVPLSSWAPMRPDWKQDMIWLPSPAAIKALLHSPGIDRGKLQMIADAFPNHFPQPLPYVGPSSSTPSHGENLNAMGSDLRYVERGGPFIGRHSLHGSHTGSYVAASEGSAVTAEDEYDPHRPAPTFRRPYTRGTGYPMRAPTKESVRYEAPSCYPAGRPQYRDYHSQDAGSGSLRESRSRDGPPSGASIVYSHEDGSSRYSYFEPLNMNSDTTVEGVFEAIPGSKAENCRPLPLATDSEAIGASRNTDGRRGTADELASSAAAEFLNSFDPLSEENAAGPDAVTSALHVRETENRHPHLTQPLPIAGNFQGDHHSPGTRRRLGDYEPPSYRRHTPSLPIRLSSRPGLSSDPYQRVTDSSFTFAEEDGSRRSRILVAEHEYMASLPERSRRVQFYSTIGTPHDRVVACAGSQYETRYYPEDGHYPRGDRRYEVISSGLAEPLTRSGESAAHQYIDSGSLGGLVYDDNQGRSWPRGTSHEEYARAVPRRYLEAGEEYGAEGPTERQVDFAVFDDGYVEGAHFIPTRRMWAPEDGSQGPIYQPIDQPRQYTSR